MLCDAVQSDAYERITIATLNHDLLIERLLEEEVDLEEVDLVDGFGEEDGDIRRYEPERLFEKSAKVRLIKLHGSINWYLTQLPEELNQLQSLREDVYVAHVGDNPLNMCDSEGRHYRDLSSTPYFLTGQYKELEYGRDIIGDMMAVFLRALHDAQDLVVSGFGWNDAGMSDRLLSALLRNRDKKMVLLYEDVNRLVYEAKHINHQWTHELGEREQLITSISKYMCHTTWPELKEKLFA